MSGGGYHRRLVDASALAGLGSCSLADEVFTSVPMTVTSNCYKEIQSGRTDRGKSRTYRRAAQTAYDHLVDHRSRPNIILYPVPGSPIYTRNNAGEISIRKALQAEPAAFDTVVGYDDDFGPVLDPVRQAGIQFEHLAPNEPLIMLQKRGRISQDEYCEAVCEMVQKMGWAGSKNEDMFWTFDSCNSYC